MSLFISACSFSVSSLSFMNVRTNEKVEMLLFVSVNIKIIKAYFYTQHLLAHIHIYVPMESTNFLYKNAYFIGTNYMYNQQKKLV